MHPLLKAATHFTALVAFLTLSLAEEPYDSNYANDYGKYDIQPNSFETLIKEIYMNGLEEQDKPYGHDPIFSSPHSKRFSEFIGGKRSQAGAMSANKRFSEFIGGKRSAPQFETRFSEFPGGRKRQLAARAAQAKLLDKKYFSEFLGGKRSVLSPLALDMNGLVAKQKKRFSEFPGGEKRFNEFIGGKKRFSEFPGGKKKRFNEFIGGKK